MEPLYKPADDVGWRYNALRLITGTEASNRRVCVDEVVCSQPLTTWPPKSIRVEVPSGILDEASEPVQAIVCLEEAFSHDLTVDLALLPATQSNLVLSAEHIVFSAGQTERQVLVSVRDGTAASAADAVVIAPTVVSPSVAVDRYNIVSNGMLFVRNLSPVIREPASSQEVVHTLAQADSIRFPWQVEDIEEDLPTVLITWDFGDGQSRTVTGATGSVSHVYFETGVFNVRMTASDKDGGTSEASFYVQVSARTSDYTYRVSEWDIGQGGVRFVCDGQGTGATFRFVGDLRESYSGVTLVVSNGARVVVDSLKIDNPSGGRPPIVAADSHRGNTLEVVGTNVMRGPVGVEVARAGSDVHSLVITTAKDNKGLLTAEGRRGAGIGGDDGVPCGAITFSGETVISARGGGRSMGIGGGQESEDGGPIQICGSPVILVTGGEGSPSDIGCGTGVTFTGGLIITGLGTNRVAVFSSANHRSQTISGLTTNTAYHLYRDEAFAGTLWSGDTNAEAHFISSDKLLAQYSLYPETGGDFLPVLSPWTVVAGALTLTRPDAFNVSRWPTEAGGAVLICDGGDVAMQDYRFVGASGKSLAGVTLVVSNGAHLILESLTIDNRRHDEYAAVRAGDGNPGNRLTVMGTNMMWGGGYAPGVEIVANGTATNALTIGGVLPGSHLLWAQGGFFGAGVGGGSGRSCGRLILTDGAHVECLGGRFGRFVCAACDY